MGCCNKEIRNKKQGKASRSKPKQFEGKPQLEQALKGHREKGSIRSEIAHALDVSRQKNIHLEIVAKKYLRLIDESPGYVKVICKPVKHDALYIEGSQHQNAGWIIKDPMQGVVFVTEDQFSKLFEIVEEEEGE
jgi:hypothetical protein